MHRLRASIPAPRLAPYEAACSGTDVDPVHLYRWAGSIALAVFEDLAVLEVAMRSAMAQQLASVYGDRWFDRTELLDDDTLKLIGKAKRLGRLDQLASPSDVVHGKLVATLMFGFWVKILGRGGYHSDRERRQRRIYDTLLWKPALRHAFPNVGDLERSRVEGSARTVQALRNRVAHHEHIIWGVPLPGATDLAGGVLRLSVTDAHNTMMSLAGFVDTELEGYLREHS
jgi:hypothetical protein